MPYTCFGPNRTTWGKSSVFTVEGWPDNAPSGYDAYYHYLIAWEVVNWNGQTIGGCQVEMSSDWATQPAPPGIDGVFAESIFNQAFLTWKLVPLTAPHMAKQTHFLADTATKYGMGTGVPAIKCEFNKILSRLAELAGIVPLCQLKI